VPRLLILASAFSMLAVAQAPRIGVIDFYGLHKVPEAKVRQALHAKEGDALPPSKGDAEERIDEIPGIVESHLEAICCDQGKIILYVGIEERGAPHFELREPPSGADLKLPEEITAAYRAFLTASEAASRRSGGTEGAREDLTHGHALSSDPETRAAQEKLIPLAKDHLAELRTVLRNSSDEEERATAAYVIGYGPKRMDVVDELQYALKDPDAGVRSNATRSLVAMAVFARLDPGAGLKIQPTWFIEMLNSLSWTDRTRALNALQILTDDRDPSILDQLRTRALAALVEMARWKTLAHALPAYVLLGRVAGIPEKEIQDAWSRGDRETIIAAANKKK
jgi:hypothetical protein